MFESSVLYNGLKEWTTLGEFAIDQVTRLVSRWMRHSKKNQKGGHLRLSWYEDLPANSELKSSSHSSRNHYNGKMHTHCVTTNPLQQDRKRINGTSPRALYPTSIEHLNKEPNYYDTLLSKQWFWTRTSINQYFPGKGCISITAHERQSRTVATWNEKLFETCITKHPTLAAKKQWTRCAPD